MDFKGIHDRLRAIQAPGLLGADEPREADPEVEGDKGRAGDPFVLVDPQAMPSFLECCRADSVLSFEMVIDQTATDPGTDEDHFWVNIQLLSLAHKHRLAVKAILPKSDPVMPTSALVHKTCRWHERECAEMFGITFEGHPDPRNILLPDDWDGNPLRKDYEYPEEYHGISCK